MATLLQDLRYGLRMLAKNPSFTAVAVLALAVGIAVNTAIFTAYNAALRPIQATDPHRIVNIYHSTLKDHYGGAFSYPDYVYYRDHNAVFSSLIAASGAELALSDTANTSRSAAPAGGGITALAGIRFFQQVAGTAEFVRAAMISENYFSGLGINPVMGRTFTPEEARGAYPVAMLSDNFWQRRFNSDPAILGKTLKLNGKQFAVIGITPKDFMGTYENVQSVWLPLSAFPLLEPGRDPFHNRDDDCCDLFARLKPGVTKEHAQSEMTVLADQLRRTYTSGSKNNQPATITLTPGSPFGPGPSPEVKAVVALVMGAVSLVLLIACANVAGMQLARSAARQKEIGVRLALGASRGRLVRQLLTEATLLAILAGGVGLFFTWWAVRYLVSAISDALPAEWGILSFQVDPDLRVFGYTLLISLIAGILFGLAPALEASKPNLVSVLKEEGTTFGRHFGRTRLRDLLVATQVAVCLILLITAGLLARGSARAVRINPGFETKKVLGMGIEIPPGLGYDAAKSGAIERQLVDRLSAVPGVKSVSVGRAPLAGGLRSTSVLLGEAQKDSKERAPVLNYSYVSPNFFATLSIPIIEGRTFTADEARSRANVTVVSQATARKLWPGQDPIGKHVTLDARDQYHDELFPAGQSFEVIGVTPDLRSAWLNELDPGYFYIPMPPNQYYESILVRTENDPDSLTAALGQKIKAVDPNVIVYAETLDGLITNNPGFVFSRVGAILSSIIGLLGLLLASVGIYGMVSYVVVQRTREVGVRMALGAQRGDVLRLIVRGSMKPVVVGLIFGVPAAGAVSRLLSGLLFGVSSLDPIIYLGVSLFLASVAALAALMPARRATRVDPMVALRYE
ncbi:MAG TPA: ABC transporter permease [Terriglobia bacterium]|nr:ABC transporter permease [Terriglobia bacterium]